MCGRALEGHMRAHGIGEESASGEDDEDDAASDWEDKQLSDMNMNMNMNAGMDTADGTNQLPEPLIKRNYELRTNPSRLKTCRVCEHCGKDFSCWRSFLEHGKCSSDEVDPSVASSMRSNDEDRRGGHCTWSKRKRSFRAKIGNVSSSAEEDDMAATCLVMLSNARVDTVDQPEESCASASREEDHHQRRINPEATVAFFSSSVTMDAKAKTVITNTKGAFECKACKKVFNSHQALGGHRASHKKVKGCFAARLDNNNNNNTVDDVKSDEDYFSRPPSSKSMSIFRFDVESGPSSPIANTNNNNNSSKRKSKVHECSICHRIFSSGQALGGHKRCHWITSNSSETTRFHPFHQHNYDPRSIPDNVSSFKGDGLELNLNLPATASTEEQDFAGVRRDPRNPLSFDVPTGHDIKHRLPPPPPPPINRNELEGLIGNDHDHDHKVDQKMTKMELEKEMKMQNEEDEAESKVKLAKLSELKDINLGGSSSPWLQVGIGSVTADMNHQQT